MCHIQSRTIKLFWHQLKSPCSTMRPPTGTEDKRLNMIHGLGKPSCSTQFNLHLLSKSCWEETKPLLRACPHAYMHIHSVSLMRREMFYTLAHRSELTFSTLVFVCTAASPTRLNKQDVSGSSYTERLSQVTEEIKERNKRRTAGNTQMIFRLIQPVPLTLVKPSSPRWDI